jgi:hypothetical protein
LVISDSLLKIIPRDKNIQNAAFRLGWEMRLKRGGTSSDGLRMLEEMERAGSMDAFTHIIISVGSNDLSNMTKPHRGTKQRWEEELLTDLKDMVRLCSKYRVETTVLEPPPRQDVPEDDRKAIIRVIKRDIYAMSEAKVVPFTKLSARDFHEHTTDGIHIKPEVAHQTICDILFRIGVTVTDAYQAEVGLRERIRGTTCYAWGHHDYRQEHRCANHTACIRCNQRGHHPNACQTRIYHS